MDGPVLMWFSNRQKEVDAQLAAYAEAVRACAAEFLDGMRRYCASGDLARLEIDLKEIHRQESLADDLRRDIEVMMYSRALFPESRGDILALLEAMDKLPNHAEASVRLMVHKLIHVPGGYRAELLELTDTAFRCIEATLDAATRVFTNLAGAAGIVGKIDALESEADKLETAMIRRIFASDLRDLEKVLLAELVTSISAICDKAETVGDRVRIIVAKRIT